MADSRDNKTPLDRRLLAVIALAALPYLLDVGEKVGGYFFSQQSSKTDETLRKVNDMTEKFGEMRGEFDGFRREVHEARDDIHDLQYDVGVMKEQVAGINKQINPNAPQAAADVPERRYHRRTTDDESPDFFSGPRSRLYWRTSC